MGILDDAIRQHLELKRKHGARDAELQQLEDEAFGPPARPGEPDFPERSPTGEHAEEGGTAVATAPEAETGEDRAEPLEPPPAEPAPAEPEERGFFDQADEPAPEREAIAGEPTAEHPAPILEPDVEAPPESVEAAPEPPAEEAAPPPLPPDPPAEEASPPSEASDEFEIGELELELDEEFEEFRPTDDPAPEAAGTEVAEPASDEHDEPVEPEAGEGPEEEGEDVLEETPEFLRDTPEDERLWFEQGTPKDFDFDDEDEDE